MKKSIIYLVTVIIILVIAVLTWQYVKQSSNNPKENSILVLPFSIDSTNEEDEYLVDGIMNGIIGNLGKVGELKVISITTANQFKDSNQSLIEIATDAGVNVIVKNSVDKYREADLKISEIAKELRVNYVLDGRIQKQGDKVRIDVQLIDAKNVEYIYAERFLRDISMLSDIATEISQEVTRNLQ